MKKGGIDRPFLWGCSVVVLSTVDGVPTGQYVVCPVEAVGEVADQWLGLAFFNTDVDAVQLPAVRVVFAPGSADRDQ